MDKLTSSALEYAASKTAMSDELKMKLLNRILTVFLQSKQKNS